MGVTNVNLAFARASAFSAASFLFFRSAWVFFLLALAFSPHPASPISDAVAVPSVLGHRRHFRFDDPSASESPLLSIRQKIAHHEHGRRNVFLKRKGGI